MALVTVTFTYTGSTQTWKVPGHKPGTLTIEVVGGGGGDFDAGNGVFTNRGGYGGWITGTLDIARGSVLTWCARVGAPDSGDTAGFQAVRDAQDAACDAVAGMHMAYTGCVDFPDLGLMSDDLHYSQVGYNTMGTAIAEHILADVPTESGLVDVNGDPVVQYQLVDGVATLVTESGRAGA